MGMIDVSEAEAMESVKTENNNNNDNVDGKSTNPALDNSGGGSNPVPNDNSDGGIEKSGTSDVFDGNDTGANDNKENNVDNSEQADATKAISDAQKAEADATKLLADKGISFDKLADEYLNDGKISEKSYQELEEAGFSRDLVNGYIAGVEARSTQVTTAVYDAVGGQKELAKIQDYIASKGNAAVDAYNALVDGGNVSAIAMFLNGQKAEMTLHTGTTNRTILGSNSTAGNVQGYKTQSEMMDAMSDPRYRTDEGYRKQVVEKLQHSNFFKTNGR